MGWHYSSVSQSVCLSVYLARMLSRCQAGGTSASHPFVMRRVWASMSTSERPVFQNYRAVRASPPHPARSRHSPGITVMC